MSHSKFLPKDEKLPAGLLALKQYPHSELFRLIVDGKLHKDEKGWLEYEKREPGSLKAAFNGLALAMTDLNKLTIDIDLIKKLHFACTGSVLRMDSMSRPFAGQLRSETKESILKFFKDTITQEGLLELLNTIEAKRNFKKYEGPSIAPMGKYTTVFKSAIDQHSIEEIRKKYSVKDNKELAGVLFPKIIQENDYVYIAPRGKKIFLEELQAILNSYNSSIEKENDPDLKLHLIVSTISDLNHLRPFSDGNIRTFAILLLNRLLIQNGFFPVTFENPNYFDGYSKQEMVNIVKQAMENTKKILNGDKDLFGFQSKDISEESQKQFQDMTAHFVSAIEKVCEKPNEVLEFSLEKAPTSLLSLKKEYKTESIDFKTFKNEEKTYQSSTSEKKWGLFNPLSEITLFKAESVICPVYSPTFCAVDMQELNELLIYSAMISKKYKQKEISFVLTVNYELIFGITDDHAHLTKDYQCITAGKLYFSRDNKLEELSNESRNFDISFDSLQFVIPYLSDLAIPIKDSIEISNFKYGTAQAYYTLQSSDSSVFQFPCIVISSKVRNDVTDEFTMTTHFLSKKPEKPTMSHSKLLPKEEKLPVGLLALKQYPHSELFRLIVDGRLHKNEKGWLGYEKREPGSLNAAFNGLALAMTDLNKLTIDIDLIKKLHFACTGSVLRMSGMTRPFAGQLRSETRTDTIIFKFTRDTITQAGLLELLNTIEAKTKWGSIGQIGKHSIYTVIDHDSIKEIRKEYSVKDNEELAGVFFPKIIDKNDYVYIVPKVTNHFLQELETILDRYNSGKEKLKHPELKLYLIVMTISDLNHLHPFWDANIRTFAILLLNRLLIQNGFYPVTFENPNCFDGYSEQEMVNIIKQAMENTKKILKGDKDLFGFHSKDIPEESQKQFQNMIAHFISIIEKVCEKPNEVSEFSLEKAPTSLLSLTKEYKNESVDFKFFKNKDTLTDQTARGKKFGLFNPLSEITIFKVEGLVYYPTHYTPTFCATTMQELNELLSYPPMTKYANEKRISFVLTVNYELIFGITIDHAILTNDYQCITAGELDFSLDNKLVALSNDSRNFDISFDSLQFVMPYLSDLAIPIKDSVEIWDLTCKNRNRSYYTLQSSDPSVFQLPFIVTSYSVENNVTHEFTTTTHFPKSSR